MRSLLNQKMIKSLPFYVVLCFGIGLLTQLETKAQSAVQEKVERYLYTCYDANKSGIKENDRVLAILEKQLNDFLFVMDKTTADEMKAHEKEFNEFLGRMDNVKDVKMMQQLVEDSKKSYRMLVANVLERGVQSVSEAKDCRKAIIFKMMEIDVLKLRQEKLASLLKDDLSRGKFIHSLVSAGNLTDQTDLRNLMVTVDNSIARMEM